MSSYKKPRLKRGLPPEKPVKKHKYRLVLPELIRDFGERCAYSMQHQARCGALEVDHFDPRKKKNLIQDYNNLFPASRHCNGKKSDHWPNKAELAAGCRFLNPCEEMDYNDQIFEDQQTHKLIGINPASRWHIRICGLNADRLIEERRRRAKHWRTLNHKTIKVRKNASNDTVKGLISSFREEVELMIPPISPPPKT